MLMRKISENNAHAHSSFVWLCMCRGVSMLNSESSEASRGRRAAVTVRSGLDPQTEGKAGPAGKWIGPWLSGEGGRQPLKGRPFSINIKLKIYFSTFEAVEHVGGRVGTNEEAHLFEPRQATLWESLRIWFFSPLDGFWFSTLILSLVIGRITNYFFQVCDFILSECSVWVHSIKNNNLATRSLWIL